MESVHQNSESGLQAMLIRGLGEERDLAEREALEAGATLPLTHRAVWAEHVYHGEPWFLLVRDAGGRACAGVAIEVVRTRSMPGWLVFRVGKFGGNLPDEVCTVALEAITKLARITPRVLRLQLNVFSRNGREAIRETLEELGMREVRPPSSYRHTLVIDLKSSEAEIFTSFSKPARRRIRATEKLSLRSAVITDPIYAERLKELKQESFQRTGGRGFMEDWPEILKMSREHPDLSRVVGLFLSEDTAPENLGAFGWCCNNGNHAEYLVSASTRRSDVQIPFSYLLMWDLVRWAKATGAEWFDIGGVTLADGGQPELEGISSFKRHFSSEVVEVGEEWVLEPVPLQAKIASAVSDGAERIRGWIGKRG